MTVRLEGAVNASSDPPPPSSYAVSHLVSTGGRPRIEIDPAFLAQALPLRSKQRIGQTVSASARTVRRRAVEQGLQASGLAPFTRVQREDGEIAQVHNNVPRLAETNITDEHLQQEIAAILHEFPHYGRSMLRGALTAKGYTFTVLRLRAAYVAVHGAPAVFGHRPIQRRVYAVPGVNSLWHHDGQHGEIHFE